jgi:uncharacterized protein YcgI (DUF1989 family)
MTSQLTTIPARHGIAVPLSAGQTIKVINTHGNQVVDTWAFTLSSFPPSPSSAIKTQLSMQHTRASLCRVIPHAGDGLYDNERKKILTMTEDTTAGHHDTLMAACDKQRYEELGGGSSHRNCSDNLGEGLAAIGWLAPLRFLPPFPLSFFSVARINNIGAKLKYALYRSQSAAIHSLAVQSVHEHPSP